MKRQGFTLVEMLVAMTLTLFIMVILSQAFITGLDTFSQLKGIGDMEDNLRVATNNLRSDLAQDHFEAKRRLSDPTFQLFNVNGSFMFPPKQGFFRIYQATPPYQEGSDLADPSPPNALYGLDPTQFPPVAPVHMLHFTIKLRGNRRENFLAASAGPALLSPNTTNFFGQPADSLYQGTSLYTSQWGEVFYFVVASRNGDGTLKTTDPLPGTTAGTQLYSLYRAQFVAVPRNDQVNAQNAQTQVATTLVPASYTNIACNAYTDSANSNNYLYFYSPGDLAKQPAAPSSLPPSPGSLLAPRTIDPTTLDPINNTIMRGTNTVAATPLATLVSSNVLHFTVQMMTRNSSGVSDTDFNTDARDFDTAATPGYQVFAVQISIRVWDQKTQQARQISIVQDM